MKRIAVFGDTHGHLRLLLQLCRLWQMHNGIHLDAVLQCGDFGYFPDLANLDKATRRHARLDPEESAFARYFASPKPPGVDPLVKHILASPFESLERLRCPVHWCHGNHEDFAALERLSVGSDRADAAPSVDAFGVFRLLRPGTVHNIEGLLVAALGGGPEHEYQGIPTERSELIKTIHPTAAGRLEDLDFQVLLTHCGPSDIVAGVGETGSRHIEKIVWFRQPAYHFYSHHGKAVAPATVGKTKSVWLADVNFEKSKKGMHPFGALEDGCMALLSWEDPDRHEMEIVRQPWMKRLTWFSWTRL